MITLYLAGAPGELERVLPIVQAIDAMKGVGFARRWWDFVLKHGSSNPPGLSLEQRAECAAADIDAVLESDVLWLLYPNSPSVDAFVEFGAALGEDKPVLITGPRAHESIFATLAETVHEEDSRGLKEIELFVRVDRLERQQ